MVGDLQVLGRMHASLEAIGNEHVGAQGDDVVASTRGAFGRAVNWMRSAFGGAGERANRGVVGNLVAQLRAAHVSDAALDVAQRLLSAQAAPGKPLSGRVAAQVLDTVIKWTSEEQAQSANLDINITGLQDRLAGEFDTIFTQRYTRFGMGDVAPAAEDRGAIMDAFRTKCRQWGERHGMHAPGIAEAREMLGDACRMRGLARLDASLAARLEEVGGHATPDAPLCQRLRTAMQARGMEFDFAPADLDKLHSRLKAKFETSFKIVNTHPPTAEEAVAAADKVVGAFLDSLQVIDDAPLSAEQKAAARTMVLSAPFTINTAMAQALCECLPQVSQAVGQLVAGGQNAQAIATTLRAITNATAQAVEIPNGDPMRPALRPGLEGADEVTAVRAFAIGAGLQLAGATTREGAQALLDGFSQIGSEFQACRFALAQSDPGDRRRANDTEAAVHVLDTLIRTAGVRGVDRSLLLEMPGVGQLNMAQVRAAIPANVHGVGRMETQPQVDTALLGQQVAAEMTKEAARHGNSLPIANVSQEFQQHYLSKFGADFLKDFFRNGIMLDGHQYGATGTQDPAAMAQALRDFADAFPSIDMAADISRSLHQGVVPMVLTGLSSQPGAQGMTMAVLTGQGTRLAEGNRISLATRQDGSYTATVAINMQYGEFDPEGLPAPGMGMCVELQMSMRAGEGNVTVQPGDCDVVFSQNQWGR
uniref:Uncharacterized protein n=1 Tax=Nitratidesulfovibrio vulgaris (strain DSM 19637 / Miyazaki F) TaxID=883 RepID=B8DIP9_NITV9